MDGMKQLRSGRDEGRHERRGVEKEDDGGRGEKGQRGRSITQSIFPYRPQLQPCGN